MRIIRNIAVVLVIIGGINWGLVGLFDYNLVEALFGAGTTLTKTVYIVVGISALLAILALIPEREVARRRV